jgi:NADH-quinone oxidoreductase subunit E
MSDVTIYSHPFSKSPDMWQQSLSAPFSQAMTPFVPVSTGAANLMAPAIGAAAAMTAVGTAVAACAWGSMMGAMTGALSSGKAPLLPGYDTSAFFGFIGNWDENEPETGALKSHGSSAGARAETTARTVAADVESAVKDVEDAGRKLVRAVSEDIENAVSSAASVTKRAKPVASEKTGRKAKPELPRTGVDMKKPAGIEKPSAIDDLKKISGIGPKLEMVLNDLGIFTFGQIAAWTAAEIAWIDDYLSFSGRIERDNWIEQASALANKRGAATSE